MKKLLDPRRAARHRCLRRRCDRRRDADPRRTSATTTGRPRSSSTSRARTSASRSTPPPRRCGEAARRRSAATSSSRGIEPIGPGDYRFAMTPSLGDHGKERLLGCMNDLSIDRLRSNVESVEDVPLGAAAVMQHDERDGHDDLSDAPHARGPRAPARPRVGAVRARPRRVAACRRRFGATSSSSSPSSSRTR